MWAQAYIINGGSQIVINSGSYLILKGNLINTTDGDNAVVNYGEISLTGNFTNNASSGKLLTNTTGKVALVGSTEQIIGGASPTYFGNLEINNTSAVGITINTNTYLESELTLTDGVVTTTTANQIIMQDGSSYSGGSDASHISGPMTKIGSSDFTFPIGKDNFIAQIGISSLPSSQSFTAQYFRTTPTNYTTYNGVNINDVSSKEYWDIHPASGSPTINLVLYWNNGTFSGINNPTNLVGAHYTADSWEEIPFISSTGSASNGSLTFGPVSSYSNYTFGSIDNVEDPLPIELLYFNVTKLNNSVDIVWTTATEINNDFFNIERSINNIDWKSIGTIDGAGNSNTIIDYSFIDNYPTKGVSYYRLKQTDFDGLVSYSETRIMKFGPNNIDINIFPNPCINSITVEGIDNTKTYYSLKNSLGQNIVNNLRLKNYSISFNELDAGIYYLTIFNNSINKTIKVIKQ